MSLDFTNTYNKEILFSIQNECLNYFEKAYFDLFNKKYNDLIDLYGDFRLEINHLNYLKTIIEEDHNKPDITKQFILFLANCINNNTVLKAYGN